MTAAGLTYMSLERWLDAELCQDLQYATLLRDPLDRIVSNEVFTYGKQNHTGEIMRWVEPGAAHFPDYKDQLIDASTATYDNFYIRTLVGASIFKLPAGQITREHLQAAKDRLRGFSVVMVLDGFERHAAQLMQLMGWTTLKADCNDARLKPPKGSEWVLETICDRSPAHPSPFTETQLQKLRERNALDYELYCFAKELAELRTSAALAHMVGKRRAGYA